MIWGWRLLTLAGVLAAWEGSTRAGYLARETFTPPSDLVALLVEWFRTNCIGVHVLATLTEAMLGYLIGVLMGVGVATLLAFNRFVDELLNPVVAGLNAIPKITLAPLFVLWLGLDFKAKVAMAGVLVFFIVFFNVYVGIKQIDRDLINNARVMGASRYRLLAEIYLPATFMWLMTSLRVSVGFAFIGAIVGEYVGANRGLGYVIALSTATNDMSVALAGLVLVVLLVLLVDVVLQRVERHFTAWKLF